MRTLRNQPFPQDGNDVKFPDGQIRNETDTEPGTPVVRELYGDVITNIYSIIRDSGINFTETEDSEDTQYQLLDALKLFTNKLNDLRQTISVSQESISVMFNLDNIPDNYLFIGKNTDEITKGINYTITSTGNNEYPVIFSNTIPASSVVLSVFNQTGLEIIPISSLSENTQSINTPFGAPLSFNSSDRLLYLSQGNIIDNFPRNYQVELLINSDQSVNDIKILQAVAIKNKLLCFTIRESTLDYQLFYLNLSDLSVLQGEINIPLTSGSNNDPYMYTDGDLIYFTNSNDSINSSGNNNDIGVFSLDETSFELTSSRSFSLDILFQKTTNVFVDPDNSYIYTYINGNLLRFNMDSSSGELIGFFNVVNGAVFRFNGNTYYSNGSLATQWNY